MKCTHQTHDSFISSACNGLLNLENKPAELKSTIMNPKTISRKLLTKCFNNAYNGLSSRYNIMSDSTEFFKLDLNTKKSIFRNDNAC